MLGVTFVMVGEEGKKKKNSQVLQQRQRLSEAGDTYRRQEGSVTLCLIQHAEIVFLMHCPAHPGRSCNMTPFSTRAVMLEGCKASRSLFPFK